MQILVSRLLVASQCKWINAWIKTRTEAGKIPNSWIARTSVLEKAQTNGKENQCKHFCHIGGLITKSCLTLETGVGPPWLVAQTVKTPPAMQETQVQSLSWDNPLEKGMTTHFSILAWRTPWTEEPGGQHPIGSQRAGHDWMTSTVFVTILS